MDSPQIDQVAVRDALAAVGGYWRPSAGVIRLLEELGEVAEALGGDDDAALADELADVWIISTAVADQYLAPVAPLPSDQPAAAAVDGSSPASGAAAAGVGAGRGAAARDHLAVLLTRAGEIARIVNHYDGPKTPKHLDDWIGLGPAMSAFQRALGDFAAARGIALGPVVASKLALLTARDRGRFAPSYDASTAPVLARVRAAHPQLAEARLLGAPDWDPASADLAAAAAVKAIATFVKAGEPEHLDGLLVPAPAELRGAALAGWWGELAARARQAGWPLDPSSMRATVVDPDAGAASGFAVVQRRATIATSALSGAPWWERVSSSRAAY